MPGPYKKETLTEKQVKEWLKKAQLEKINIFYNTNEIITKLCYALMEAKGWNKK